MDANQEVQRRKDELDKEFVRDMKEEVTRAALCNGTSMTLLVIAIVASGFAGIGGASGFLSGKLTGAIAILPSFLLLFARSLKLDERAAWHFRKFNRLEDLRHQLLYQQPLIPTPEQIAHISKKKQGLNHFMLDEWKAKLNSNWETINQLAEEHNLINKKQKQFKGGNDDNPGE